MRTPEACARSSWYQPRINRATTSARPSPSGSRFFAGIRYPLSCQVVCENSRTMWMSYPTVRPFHPPLRAPLVLGGATPAMPAAMSVAPGRRRVPDDPVSLPPHSRRGRPRRSSGGDASLFLAVPGAVVASRRLLPGDCLAAADRALALADRLVARRSRPRTTRTRSLSGTDSNRTRTRSVGPAAGTAEDRARSRSVRPVPGTTRQRGGDGSTRLILRESLRAGLAASSRRVAPTPEATLRSSPPEALAELVATPPALWHRVGDLSASPRCLSRHLASVVGAIVTLPPRSAAARRVAPGTDTRRSGESPPP